MSHDKNLSEHAQMVADCEAREGRLSDWERGFVDSLARQLAQGRSLTDKQSTRLDEVWTSATGAG